jgi:23S rRNA pseudouridine2605 synthase
MAYNRSGGRPRSVSGKGKAGDKKGKFSSSRDKDQGSEKKFRKPFSEKDKKHRSKDDDRPFSKRSGGDDGKGKYKKDDSYVKEKYSRGDTEKKFKSDRGEGASKYKRKDDDGYEKKPKFEKEGSYGKDKYSRDPDKKFKKDDSFRKNDKFKGDGEKKHYRPFAKDHSEGGEKKRKYDSSFFDTKKDGGSDKFDKPYKKKHDDHDSDKPYKKKFDGDSEKPYKKKYDDQSSEKPYKKKYDDRSSDKPFKRRSGEFSEEKRFKQDEFEEGKGFKGHSKDKEEFRDKKFRKNKFGKDNNAKQSTKEDDGTTRLNKYLAHAGISSRRDADVLIKGGTVKVNGVVITEMGYKVKPGDVVTYADSTIKNERKVYLLLNKPKDFITTTDDPQERRTVMELVKPACKERIYPVGRLDRNTTGLLLFTNDGDLATKLMHPKHEIRKVYHVTLNRPLTAEDYKTINEGFDLQDGPVKVDDIAYVGEGKKEVGLEIHSGRNRIVRRLFEHLGYEVIKLDRVSYAGLTKKDLARGKYRFLSEKEVAFLKMLS